MFVMEKSLIRTKASMKLEMKVEVEAENQADAEAFVSEKWYNSEYILDADHFKGVTFTAEKILRNREEHER